MSRSGVVWCMSGGCGVIACPKIKSLVCFISSCAYCGEVVSSVTFPRWWWVNDRAIIRIGDRFFFFLSCVSFPPSASNQYGRMTELLVYVWSIFEV